MPRLFFATCFALLLPPLVGLAPKAAAQDVEEMYDKLVRSVTGILVPMDNKTVKLGAGVLVDAEKRLVLTSYAVVRESKQVGVTFPVFDKTGQQMTDLKKYLELVERKEGIVGDVIARDKKVNLAVIRLHRSPPTGTQAVKLAEKSVTQAMTVWGFGHPLSGGPTQKEGQMFNITEGKVRSIGVQEFVTGDGDTTQDFRVNCKTLSLTNPMNHGDEGGPLFNIKGELVGIQHGPDDQTKAQLVSLGVDLEEINKFLEENKLAVKGTLTLEAKAAPPPVDTEALYQKSVRAAVFITTASSSGSFSMGSGSLIDVEKRLVVTNYHVVDKEEWVHVQFPYFDKNGVMVTDKKKYIERVPLGMAIKAEVQYRDSTRDLAIIKLTKAPPPGTPALPLAETGVRPGKRVWNIGSPGAVDQVFSTTSGIVRCVGLQQYLVGGGSEVMHINARVLTVTLPTNPGDSGGPYINEKGELVAVHHAGQPRANLLSKAIDVSELKAFLAEKGYEIKGVSKLTTPKVNPKDPPKTNPMPKDAPSADEKAAESALRLAKTLAGNEDARDRYKERLREIVKKYPETVAGKEAKRLLDALK